MRFIPTFCLAAPPFSPPRLTALVSSGDVNHFLALFAALSIGSFTPRSTPKLVPASFSAFFAAECDARTLRDALKQAH